MNWGYKILFVYLAFVAGILFLVYKASNVSFDLVEENYYEQELKFQNRIDDQQRVYQLSDTIAVSKREDALQIHFPKDFLNQEKTGEAYLYFPADAAKDYRYKFSQTGEMVSVPVTAVQKGQYYLKLSWKVSNQSYYYEQKLKL
jgi:hypothetical protein